MISISTMKSVAKSNMNIPIWKGTDASLSSAKGKIKSVTLGYEKGKFLENKSKINKKKDVGSTLL